MSKLSELDLGVQLALIDHFNIDVADAETVFGNTAAELQTARELASAGTITIATDIDFSQYEGLLGVKKSGVKEETATATERPVTATRPTTTPKKRGRKGDKIKNAFAAIPEAPVDAEAFIAEHNISMAVLRQAKRLDTSGLPGRVHVRKKKETGVLSVWRDAPTAE